MRVGQQFSVTNGYGQILDVDFLRAIQSCGMESTLLGSHGDAGRGGSSLL